eukprot:g1477.t1
MAASAFRVLLASALCTATALPFAFSNTLGDHAVLQNPIVIWGFGTPGSQVSTVVNASAGSAAAAAATAVPSPLQTVVGADGIWRQPLPAMTEGLTAYTISSRQDGADAAVLEDVLIGRTLLCSGQSNIDLVTVPKAINGTAELAACADWPHVRFLKAQGASGWNGPHADLGAPSIPWSLPSDASCETISATCFFAARELFAALGGGTPVGVLQSAVGGTAVRQWVPTEALARCSQPWAGLMHYGAGPYAASTHYNAMIAPFGTGPTAFSFVLWDQAESDSFPQTNPGYYGCQTLAHVASWRRLLRVPSLPWVLVHLQPYTGSESGATACEIEFGRQQLGSPLAELRHAQLAALALPGVGYASAIDLGDPTSPYGDVHYRHKQVVSRRAVSAALSLAFGREGGAGGALAYPPPGFLTQAPRSGEAATCAMTVRLANLDGGDAAAVVLGATPNPVLPGNGSGVCYPTLASAVPYGNATCGGFELLCSTPEVPHEPSNPSAWVPASATVSADGMALTLTAKAGTGVAGLVARGSRYAWADFPQATLFAAAPGGGLGLPVLPWNQALVCSGASPLPAGAVC